MYKLWKKGGIYILYIFFYPTYKPFLLVNESGNIIFIYEWSFMWWSGVVFVVNVWCELWAWWTWGHLPNCHNLLSLIDFQLSLKSSKQSTSDLTTTPTPTQSSHLSSFLQRIFPQQLIDIYLLAGLVSPVHCAQGEHYCCMKCTPLGLKIILMR